MHACASLSGTLILQQSKKRRPNPESGDKTQWKKSRFEILVMLHYQDAATFSIMKPIHISINIQYLMIAK